MDPLHEQIERILDGFDFDRVKRVMEFLEWRWQRERYDLPTYNELRKAAKTMLQDVAQESDRAQFSGGLEASNYGGYLSLKFVLAWNDTDISGAAPEQEAA